jgi:hypothetical protein
MGIYIAIGNLWLQWIWCEYDLDHLPKKMTLIKKWPWPYITTRKLETSKVGKLFFRPPLLMLRPSVLIKMLFGRDLEFRIQNSIVLETMLLT